MTDYSSKRALEIWYETIGIKDLMEAFEDRDKARVKQRVETAKEKSSPAFVFPKLVEHRGAEPRFKDDPPLIFHPSEEMAPGVTKDIACRWNAIARRCPIMFACCWTVTTSAMSR